jgi:hypothetical protein
MQERARTNRFYATATGGVLLTLAALSFLVWLFRPPVPDPETLCPTRRPIAAHTLVIVDRTDRWDDGIEQTLTQLIEDAQRNTARYEKFSIVALDSNLSTHPLFSICNPGEPNFLTDLYKGRRYTKRDFDQKFVGAAESVIASVRRPAQASTSPIVEYIHAWLGRDDFNADIPKRRLVLLSDMRQNSTRVSLYRTRNADELSRLVAHEMGKAGRDVVYDVYFVAHGRDYNVPESQVRDAWSRAFAGISAKHEWRYLN